MASDQVSIHRPVVHSVNQDIFLSVDKEWRLLQINDAGTSFFHIAEQSVGKLLNDVIPEDLNGIMDTLREASEQQNSTTFQFHVNNFSAPYWMEANVYPCKYVTNIMIRKILESSHCKQSKEKHLSILTEAANEMIMQHEPKIILDTLFQQLTEYLDLDVYINYKADNDKLRLTNYAGISDEAAKELENLEFGQAVCGFVAQSKVNMTLENVHCSNDPKVQFIKALGIKSYACFPLIAYNKFLGTLSFGSLRKPAFSKNELELMNTICSQVAITIERSNWIERLRLKKQLADQANQAKSAFLSMMSHELRTPLNSIIGLTDLMIADEVDPLGESQRLQALDIHNSGSHLLWLINEILEYTEVRDNTSPGSFKQERVSIALVLNASMEMIKNKAQQKKIRIVNSLDLTTKIHVQAHPIKLKNVFSQLLLNAINYNRFGGIISVSHEKIGSDLIITIKDTGTGIPPEDLPNIFTPFYRGSEHQSLVDGAGIGLALAKELLEKMNGKIGALSVYGEGTTVWISLPLYRDNQAAPLMERGLINGTILYIEDNRMNISLMKNIFKLLPNVRLEIAQTGEEGVEAAKSLLPDLILLDIQLPKMSGFDVYSELSVHPSTRMIPVIAVSADAMPQTIQRAIGMGFNEYLTKPLNIDELLSHAKMHLKNKSI